MAIWKKLFSKITFKDYPDTSTPLNADNLNKMTDAIDGIDDRVVELNSNLSKFGLYDATAINHGYYNGGYYIEWFFADNNKYRLVSTLNDIALTYWDGKEWTTKWSLNSNLTTNNYYYNSGVVLDDGDGGYIEGGGTVTMTIVGNIARIDFSIRINKNNTPSDFDSICYGINRNLLVNLGFPKVTPLTGGSLFYYGSDGTIKNDMTYMGGIFEHFYDEYWTPSRIYNEQYVGGAWQSRTLPVSLIMRGTCYGRVE